MIEKNFSRHAHLYDRYADIQRMAAFELIKMSPADGVRNILEIGCGTGNYTLLLREKFKSSRITALDISKGMLSLARQKLQGRRIEFITADAEELNLDDKFDLITSNAAFQWFDDLEKAIERYGDLLTEEGAMSFSVFGPSTFRELRQSLKETLGEDITISAENFLDKWELDMMLNRLLNDSAVKEWIVTESYLSLRELLNKIKYTGARGNGINNSFLWKKRMLNSVEEIYKTRYGRITATYQILFCKAKK